MEIELTSTPRIKRLQELTPGEIFSFADATTATYYLTMRNDKYLDLGSWVEYGIEQMGDGLQSRWVIIYKSKLTLE